MVIKKKIVSHQRNICREQSMMSSGNTSNTSFLCRLCQKSDLWYIDIFEWNAENEIMLHEIIQELTQIPITEDDGLPSTVCQNCMKKLIEFNDFKVMCIRSVIELRKPGKGGMVWAPVDVGVSPSDVEQEDGTVGSLGDVNASSSYLDEGAPLGPEMRAKDPKVRRTSKRKERPSSSMYGIQAQGSVPDAALKNKKHLEQYGLSFEEAEEISQGSTDPEGSPKEATVPTGGLGIGFSKSAGKESGAETVAKDAAVFQCEHCDKRYDARHKVIRHLRKFHGIWTRAKVEEGGKKKKKKKKKEDDNNAWCAEIPVRGQGTAVGDATVPVRPEDQQGDRGGETSGLQSGEGATEQRNEAALESSFNLSQYLFQRLWAGPDEGQSPKRRKVTTPKEGGHPCPHCDKVYKNAHNLKNHVRIHVGKFGCKVCLQSFSSIKNLQDHKRIHKVKWYCRVCGLEYDTKTQLLDHAPVHVLNSCQCKDCGKAFQSKLWLAKHCQRYNHSFDESSTSSNVEVESDEAVE